MLGKNNLLRRRQFASLAKIKQESTVLIVGAGPVGMILSAMLNHFNVDNQIVERAT